MPSISLLPPNTSGGGLQFGSGGGGGGTISLLPAGAGGSGGGIFPSGATVGATQGTQSGPLTYSPAIPGSYPFTIGPDTEIGSQQSSIRYLSDNWLSQLLDEPNPQTGYKQVLVLAAILIGAKLLK